MKNKNIISISCLVLALFFSSSVNNYGNCDVANYTSTTSTTNNAIISPSCAQSEESASLSECMNFSIESYIENNLDDVVNEINYFIDKNDSQISEYSTLDNNYLNATSIEYCHSTWIVEDECYATYIDFNDDNGYLVVDDDYTIHGLEVSGDIELFRDGRDLIYSEVDGFLYVDEDGTLQKIFENKKIDTYDTSFVQDDEYVSGAKVEDGEILPSNLSNYMAVTYSSSCEETAYNTDLESTFDFGKQRETSYYKKITCDKDGNKISNGTRPEGNCSLNTMYNLLRNWSKNGKIDSIDYSSTKDVTSLIKSDPLYKTYVTDRTVYPYDSGGYYYWTENDSNILSAIPSLYIDIRNIASEEDYGYTPINGFKSSYVPDVLSTIASDYDIKIKTNSSSSISSAISSVDKGKAVYVSISDSVTYGNHGVSLIGYRKYKFTRALWTFKKSETIYLFEVADNWNASAMYFDPNINSCTSTSFIILK